VSNLLTAYKKNAAGFGDQEERQHIRKLFARLGSYVLFLKGLGLERGCKYFDNFSRSK
jgi:hypothetical protein